MLKHNPPQKRTLVLGSENRNVASNRDLRAEDEPASVIRLLEKESEKRALEGVLCATSSSAS